jgi:peptidoglycan hydrolase CwlO-like protein
MASSIEAIQKILQETVAPGISDLRERLTRVEVEIKRLDDTIDNGLARLDAKIGNLDNKIDSVRGEIKTEIHHLDDKLTTALEIRERLAALEAKVAAH